MRSETITVPDRKALKTAQGGGDFNHSAGRSILIVEEDASLANFLCRELRAGSFTVDSVFDGETALATLQDEGRRDLLILELNLPKLDGMSLLQRVRQARPRLPMMVLSARSRVEDKVKAFQ